MRHFQHEERESTAVNRFQFANGKTIPGLGEGQNYKYLGITRNDGIKFEEMKVKVKNEYAGQVKKILKSKLNRGNKVTLCIPSLNRSIF